MSRSVTLRMVPGLLDQLKEVRGFTEEQLADELEVHRDTLRRVRNGHPPSAHLIANVARLTGRSIEKVVEVVPVKRMPAVRLNADEIGERSTDVGIPGTDRQARPVVRSVRDSCTCRAAEGKATSLCRHSAAPAIGKGGPSAISATCTQRSTV
ncbi:helix-turn-helix domain-containing protein [Nocardia transvalensis]|uniref:helix-turn-helix domain-containing protein n=1 Tax=Nocardia transvalensis TaxID=37333 RepID=UPI001894BD64|nr:helix-turn-helix transcriptional regulator [Nocardia transvalensis]MBF6333418.1 helix-turn-helix transcriptional regulator [Nocardia transvalensis]